MAGGTGSCTAEFDAGHQVAVFRHETIDSADFGAVVGAVLGVRRNGKQSIRHQLRIRHINSISPCARILQMPVGGVERSAVKLIGPDQCISGGRIGNDGVRGDSEVINVGDGGG